MDDDDDAVVYGYCTLDMVAGTVLSRRGGVLSPVRLKGADGQ